MTINTQSGFSVQTVAATKHVITHCLKYFSYMRIPKFIKKTENGSGYVSKELSNFVPDEILNIRQTFLIILKD